MAGDESCLRNDTWCNQRADRWQSYTYLRASHYSVASYYLPSPTMPRLPKPLQKVWANIRRMRLPFKKSRKLEPFNQVNHAVSAPEVTVEAPTPEPSSHPVGQNPKNLAALRREEELNRPDQPDLERRSPDHGDEERRTSNEFYAGEMWGSRAYRGRRRRSPANDETPTTTSEGRVPRVEGEGKGKGKEVLGERGKHKKPRAEPSRCRQQ